MSESVRCATEADTFELGRQLAGRLERRGTVWLEGPLGAGKTVLAKGLFAACGVDPARVVSPTFTLVNRYSAQPPLHHVDLYRLQGPRELLDIGLEELVDGPGLVVIEWGERLAGLLPAPRLHVRLTIADDDTRSVELEWSGEPPQDRQ